MSVYVSEVTSAGEWAHCRQLDYQKLKTQVSALLLECVLLLESVLLLEYVLLLVSWYQELKTQVSALYNELKKNEETILAHTKRYELLKVFF